MSFNSMINRILQQTEDFESQDAGTGAGVVHGNQFSKTLIVVILFLGIVLVMWNIFKTLKETTQVSISSIYSKRKKKSGQGNKEDEKILGDVEVTEIV